MPYLRPHLYAPRQLGDGHKIHESVYELEGYEPKARLFNRRTWESESESYSLMEIDLRPTAEYVVRMLQSPLSRLPVAELYLLDGIVEFEDGRRALQEAWKKAFTDSRNVFDDSKKVSDDSNIVNLLYHALAQFRTQNASGTLNVRQEYSSGRLSSILAIINALCRMRSTTEVRRPYREIRSFVDMLPKRLPYTAIAQWFEDTCISAELYKPLEGHTGAVRSVAFSHDGQWIVSGSNDYTIRVWNVGTGQEHKLLEKDPEHAEDNEHTVRSREVRSVVFSQDNRIASGSEDAMIHIWSIERGLLRTFRADSCVNCVAFSPDGNIVASGSDNPDCAIRLLDLDDSTPDQKGLQLFGVEVYTSLLVYTSIGE